MGQELPVASSGDHEDSKALLAPVVHVRPESPAEGLAWLTDRLYAPLQIDGGTLSLAGCLFDEIPFLGLGIGTQHRWFDAVGEEVTGEFARSLGLAECQPHDRVPRLWRELEKSAAVLRLREAGRSLPEPSDLIVAWVRWVHGKLAVSGAKRTVDIPFEGWASHFASGRSRAESFCCPETGARGDRIVVTADGEPTVSSEVENCVVSGKCRLEKRMAQCAASQRWASIEYLQACPVSGERILPDSMVECRSCLQSISPNVISQQTCTLCRLIDAQSISPAWQNWVSETLPDTKSLRWKFATGAESGVFVAKGWLGQTRVVVVNLASQRLIRMRRRSLLGKWETLAEPTVS